MSGIVEELFIANDLSGVSQVWFRNWSVTASLNLRPLLNADPESVKWGSDKERFVVRTGTALATQRYYVFRLARDVAHIFGAGVIPAATLETSYLPFQSALTLTTLTATRTIKTDLRFASALWNITRTSAGGSCPGVPGIGPVVNQNLAGDETDTGTATLTVTLGTLLDGTRGTPVRVEYALDRTRNLLLWVIGRAGTPSWTNGTRVANTWTPDIDAFGEPCNLKSVTTTTLNLSGSLAPRFEQHLWVVNLTTNTVLSRTTLAAPSISKTQNNLTSNFGGFSGSVMGPLRAVGSPAAPNCPLEEVVCLSGTTVSPTTAVTVDLGLVGQSGISAQADSLWDTTTYSFVTGSAFAPTSVDAFHKFSPAGADTYIGGTPFGVSGGIRGSSNKRTWTLNTPFTYSLFRAVPADATTPGRMLLSVDRTGPSSQSALFLLTLAGAVKKTLRDWSTGQITILTANKRHAIWYQNGLVYMTAYDLDINGRTVQIGTSVTNAQARRYRLMSPEAVLWQGQESDRLVPAGVFLDAWEANGTPTLGDAAPAVLIPLEDFDTLAVVPAPIPLPVISTE